MTKYRDHKDDTLVQLALLGEDEAFEELVTRHERAVKGTAYKVTGNSYSAEDASQDAFVSAWMNLAALREPGKFGSWVCGIAKNHARQLVAHYRSAVPDISLDDIENIAVDDWRAEMAREADAAELHKAVDALSEKIREAISLHYFEGLSVHEMAMRLGIAEGTVKWRLSEGRKQLRKGYGIMEDNYNENEALIARVMREIEALKMWRLRDDKSGFEAEYHRVLAMVEELPESVVKQYMLAETLTMGSWWIPGADNDEMIERIREAATKGHNDEVLQSIACHDHDRYSGQERIDYMEQVQIPYYRELGFPKTLAYITFWLARFRIGDSGDTEKGISGFEEVLRILSPEHVYYANAKAAIAMERVRLALGEADKEQVSYSATGEIYRFMNGKWYFWEQPGYSYGGKPASLCALFFNCSRANSVILDTNLRVGETIAEGKNTLHYRESGASCDTPAGHFTGCSVYVCRDSVSQCETYFCPGVGIVRQAVTRYGESGEWLLADYTVVGGEGVLPFAAGNRWVYTPVPDGVVCLDCENVFEVTAAKDGQATVAAYLLAHKTGYTDTWGGKMREAREGYCRKAESDREVLVDVRPLMEEAASLAASRREHHHTEVAYRVMNRIFETDNEFNPAYTEKGFWNFFEYMPLTCEGHVIHPHMDRSFSFEWKDIPLQGENGFRVLHSFFDDILFSSVGCIWSDEWVDGYTVEEKKNFGRTVKNLSVTGGETVITPAGTFENCRHIGFVMEYDRPGFSYMTGRSDYWFAEGVGIVQYTHPINDTENVLWQLTDYRGTGEGYFPVADDLWRHYEPGNLSDGWHAYVEYTYVVDETGAVILRDAKGTQERVNYEANRTAQNG